MSQLELIRGDRRDSRRFAGELELRFTYEHRGQHYLGMGRTTDLSSGGIRFQTVNPPPNGAKVEAHIQWPFLLQNVMPLELVVQGRIIRNDAEGTVLRTSHYLFRTYGSASFDTEEHPMDLKCSVLV